METFDAKATQLRLQEILVLVKDRDGEAALAQIDSLVSELKQLDGPAVQERPPEPWRLISAHLKAAEVQIEATHLAFAEESMEKAIGVAVGEQGPAIARAP
jgi:hypothetical protein